MNIKNETYTASNVNIAEKVKENILPNALRASSQASYTNLGKFPGGHRHHPHYHGFCHACGHPAEYCCCHHPHCRCEAKELVVEPVEVDKTKALSSLADDDLSRILTSMMISHLQGKISEENLIQLKRISIIENLESQNISNDKGTVIRQRGVAIGRAGAFIGGGCCVHLSIEYMPYNVLADINSLVLVGVIDSEATLMAWAKIIGAQAGYHINEDIITTFPGARLVAIGYNMIARVRWCEVFSC